MKNNSFWSTTQGKSTIKFVAWMIFIIILIVIFAINGKPENNNIEELKFFMTIQMKKMKK